MKFDFRNLTAFLGGCAVAGIAWSFSWPKSDHSNETVFPKGSSTPPEPRSAPVPLHERLRELSEAGTDEAKLTVANAISRYSADELRLALERETLIENHQLTLAAKVLMIRWAEKDGQVATEWAWIRFRSEGLWNQVFREIGPAWAGHSPASFGAWVKERAEQNTLHDISEEVGMGSAWPLLDFDNLTRSSSWLMTEDPRVAYQILFLRGGISTRDSHHADTLRSVEQVQQALSAFDGLDEMKIGSFQGNQIYLTPILNRWRTLDPESFEKSSLSRLMSVSSAFVGSEDVKNWDSLTQERRVEVANQAISEPDPKVRDMKIFAIIRHWAAVDPEANTAWLESLPTENRPGFYKASFAASAPEHLESSLDQAGKLPPVQREACRVTAFDAWTKAHPGERADRTGWPAERVTGWEDLEALQPGEGK